MKTAIIFLGGKEDYSNSRFRGNCNLNKILKRKKSKTNIPAYIMGF